ncbi:hypothetical protein EYE42_15490 [Paracoccus subflavus]|uniref:DUF5615 domain-containing protein n=1 Tax=Paracoccus subflavus TaxID=2528244 RepID=A0A4V2JBR7_9RHOB|nr:DUF5615 family PIN-like protein [Paracoccus subflavus]TBN36567.1 hypothetical protein EYE42_15490 [Paracoccus subflavus]
MAKRLVLSFLTDANVPDSVGNALIEAGHDVVRVRDIMAADAPDPVVAEAAMRAKRILVSWDRDFNQQRFRKERFAQLSRIGFSCPEEEGARRLRIVMDMIEFTVIRADGSPITITIAKDKISVTC